MSEINTVGELAEAIDRLPDHMPLVVRSQGERSRIDFYVDDGTLFLEGFE